MSSWWDSTLPAPRAGEIPAAYAYDESAVEAERDLLADLVGRFHVDSVLEHDPEGLRLVGTGVRRLCRVPARSDGTDAVRPHERFDLVAALGVLDETPGPRDQVLFWASLRLRHSGRLVVSTRAKGQGPLSPDEAEDVLADAGFLVEEVAQTSPQRRWGPRRPGPFLIVATLA